MFPSDDAGNLWCLNRRCCPLKRTAVSTNKENDFLFYSNITFRRTVHFLERIILSSWYLHNRQFFGLLLRGAARDLGYNHENPPIHLDREA